MRFGVVGHADGLVQVRFVVDVGMTHPMKVLDHGDSGFAHEALDQAFPTARHHDIHVFLHCDELSDRCAVGRLYDLHRVLRQSGSGKAGMHTRGNCLVGKQRFRASPQNSSVT